MSKTNELNTNKANNFKKMANKAPKKVDLLKKYFYKLNLSPKKVNIFQLMENGLANQDELEAVDNICSTSLNCKNELEKKKIECLKSMILHHKQIPEKWIIQSNYKNLLDKVMSDPIILSYAIFSKDMFKKRSTSVSIDPSVIKNVSEESTLGRPKFISYINLYSKNYSDSVEKHKLMREYCYNIKNNKNRVIKNKNLYKGINLTENSYTINKNNDNKNYYLNTESKRENKLPNIFPNLKLKKIKKIKKHNKDEKDVKEDTFMMTSLYYDENNLTKDKKFKVNSQNNEKKNINDEINDEKNNKIPKKEVELPKIE